MMHWTYQLAIFECIVVIVLFGIIIGNELHIWRMQRWKK